MKTRLAALLFVALLSAAAVSCGGDDDTPSSSTPAPTPTPDAQGYVPIEWEEALVLFEACEVDWAFQSHSRDVFMIMDDGRKFRSQEPGLDDLFDVVDGLPAGCGPTTLATE